MPRSALPRRPGRPRSNASRAAILEAGFGLLAERGYAGFVLEEVAARAGVGKATLYKWWPSRGELAVDCFFAGTVAQLRFPDTGSARRDFTLQIQALRRLLGGPRGEALMALVQGARVDPLLRSALGERWVRPRQAWGLARMARAQAEGQCRPGVDAEAALDLLYGPVYTRLAMGLGVPSKARLARILALACRAIFVEPGDRGGSRR